MSRGTHAWNSVPSVHERGDPCESLAQLAARMQVGEVFFLEAATFGERNCKRVAQSEHGGGRGCRRKSQRARFAGDGTVEGDFSGLRQS